MRLIWADAKAEYFCAEGLTRFLKIRSDLPVVLFCRSRASRLRFREKQISSQQLTRISAAICGSRENDEGPGCRAHPGFCNGRWLVNPFLRCRLPGTCFCTGSALRPSPHGVH